MAQLAISLDDVLAARQRIADQVLKTPCLHSESLSKQLGCELFFKAENLQHIGAFKARGALNAVLQLDEEAAQRGVVTHSSGNHAAALARAAKIRGIPAFIVMPHNSAKVKVASVRSIGFEPVFCETDSASREQTAEKVRSETGATLIHPFDNPQVMAGQGTVGLEILEQVPKAAAVIAPVGGGGLVSGVATVINAKSPNTEVYAAEPEWADDAYRSMQSGQIESPTRLDTVADGLRTLLGELTFPVLQAFVKEVLLVSETSILAAMRRVTESAKLVVEPSGAVSFAALESNRERFQGKQVVVVLSGGNVDFGDCRLGHSGESGH